MAILIFWFVPLDFWYRKRYCICYRTKSHVRRLCLGGVLNWKVGLPLVEEYLSGSTLYIVLDNNNTSRRRYSIFGN